MLLLLAALGTAAAQSWEKMPLLSPAAAAAGIFPGGEGGQRARGPVCLSPSDPDFLLLPTEEGGVYRSMDGGQHWDLAMAGWNARGANGFAIDPQNSRHIIGIGGNVTSWNAAWSTNSPNGLYYSDTRARDWRQVLGVLPGTGGAVAFDPSSFNPSKAACQVAYYASHELGLFRSDDGGLTWAKVSRQPVGLAIPDYEPTLLAVDPRNGAVWLAGKTGLWRSDNHGASFHSLWTNGEVFGLSVPAAQPDQIFISGRAGLWHSTDAGRTWTGLAAGGIAWQADEPICGITVCPVDPRRMLCWVKGHNWAWARYVSHDGGVSFEAVNIQPGGGEMLPCHARIGYFAWHPADPEIVYGPGGDWVTRSTNGGRMFAWWNNGCHGITVGGAFNFSQHDPGTVFLGFQDDNGAVTTNGGRTWLGREVSGEASGHCCGAAAVNSRLMWCGLADSWHGLRRTVLSRDGGMTWNFARDTNGQYCVWSGADVSFSDPKHPEVLFASQWRSADGGLTWSQMDDCEGVFIATPNGRLLGRQGSLLVGSANSGATWQPIVEVPGGINDLAYDAERNRYYVASDRRLKQYEDGVLSVVDTPLDQYQNPCVKTVAVDAAAPNLVYIGGAMNIYATSAAVCRSADAGLTWTNLTVGDGPHEVGWLRVHPVTRAAWLNGQCFGNWKLPAPEQVAPEIQPATPRGTATGGPPLKIWTLWSILQSL